MYLRYLMGAHHISDQDLTAHGIEIIEHVDSENRKLKIPSVNIEAYKSLIRENMARV